MSGKIGPGMLVAAAFIGPGTITACTMAGTGFGYALLWILVLSIIGTTVLQEMAARLGIITQKGLSENIRLEIRSPFWRNLVISVVLMAVVIGNAAYEGGNLEGAILGLEAIFGSKLLSLYPPVVGILVFVLLYLGSYKVLEKAFLFLVVLMSLSFCITAILTRPNMMALLKGMIGPTLPDNSILTAIALVGTTIVPYNLFLHAALVKEKWKTKNALRFAQRDTVVSLGLGGIISITIVISAAAIPRQTITGVMDLAKGLEPLYGNMATLCMGVGLFAAGITSATTAPLAAAYVAKSCFGWKAGLRDYKFRSVWIGILVLALALISLDLKPMEVIKYAQVANGILLPFIALFLLWIVNKRSIMGNGRNNTLQNILGILIVLLVIFLGGRTIFEILSALNGT
ncbi:MAG: Nramp family divalent metal transporter [Bacteroidota bacterium]